MVKLLYQDLAMLNLIRSEWDYNSYSKERFLSRFYSYLNNVSEIRGKKNLPNEIVKSQRDIVIIKLAIKSVKEYMFLFRRNKIIDIPLQFIHIVPEGSDYEDSFFGGIVVERVADDKIFAIKLFQKLFEKMSFSAVELQGNRKVVFINENNELKRAAASLISRLFLERVVLNSDLFEEDESIIEDVCFFLESEKVFDEFLEKIWKDENKSISKEKFFRNVVEAIINGGYFDEVKPEWF
jgi:hypothetical protein